mmetsp:Transcript_12739/g.27494  ORF Transcript_12739/g.27494 Transcript_12739/m.27494 type:complete len:123 (+) Transcript_12739:208-576(+)
MRPIRSAHTDRTYQAFAHVCPFTPYTSALLHTDVSYTLRALYMCASRGSHLLSFIVGEIRGGRKPRPPLATRRPIPATRCGGGLVAMRQCRLVDLVRDPAVAVGESAREVAEGEVDDEQRDE